MNRTGRTDSTNIFNLTWHVLSDRCSEAHGKHLRGAVVSPGLPREKTGVYWGYNVRLAHTFGEVFTAAPFKVR